MRKKLSTGAIAAIIAGAICFGCTGVYAANDYTPRGAAHGCGTFSPSFKVIVICWNNLTLNSGGKLTCEGQTQVQDGYAAGITVELQQDKQGWSTIKSWSDSDWDEIYLSNDWYVEKGYSYRLKLTHKALDGNGRVLETYSNYSKTVSY